MSAASTGRPKTKAESTGDGRGGAQHTVAPTRTRHATAKSRGTRAAREQETGRGTVTAGSGGETGQPLWEDDSGALPPEEWS
ncbi:hypothetical protein CFB50_35895 [Burkholderia sp. AU33423]|uniref:Uncharacterized protein n=1 Tax=Burkholderia contaminans TaxID=488447 RepID=A0A6P3ANX4_9BURK|nr:MULTISPECIES: hypothetical protein [Burkholderia]OXI77724.1 hypothetical protein CFB50_35895 [Burkholderia sp. AU33423]OXJ25625.1 hypothetical protein CFB82_38350 [Burkholderia sp. HI2714]VWD49032.1 hypothetical protein BCO71033_05167 [Burkholderia contaminans]